jgi:hypothetical protein
MAKIKDVPNLPASSRLKPPTTSNSLDGLIKEHGGLKGGKAASIVKAGGVASKIVGTAKGKTGMKNSNPYC